MFNAIFFTTSQYSGAQESTLTAKTDVFLRQSLMMHLWHILCGMEAQSNRKNRLFGVILTRLIDPLNDLRHFSYSWQGKSQYFRISSFYPLYQFWFYYYLISNTIYMKYHLFLINFINLQKLPDPSILLTITLPISWFSLYFFLLRWIQASFYLGKWAVMKFTSC